jgi:putative ATP-dependent endonuclease of OLD family
MTPEMGERVKLVRLKLNNFRCFGGVTTELALDSINFVIGPNGSGKTAVLQALARMFSFDPAQRRVRSSDFFIAANEKPEEAPATRTLWIEADFEFPELAGANPEELLQGVPGNFGYMRMETDDGSVLVRFRLAASIDQDGDIEEAFTNVIKADATGSPTTESRVSKSDRGSIQVHYLPARRNPADHVSFAANAMLGRLLRAANWTTERADIAGLTAEITDKLSGNAAVTAVSTEVTKAWESLHKGKFYKNPSVSFARSEIETLLRHLSLTFSPGPDAPIVDFSRLSDGQQSLLYISLVLANRDIGDAALAGAKAFDIDKLRPPVFTLLAVEEPENSLSPHYLGRVTQTLKAFGAGPNSQAIVATHAPSLLRRVEPESIRYLRLNEARRTVVARIALPDEVDAEKYVRQAVKAFPELYFARLVILGEGDSEEIVLPRLLDVKGMLADDASVSVVPLGGRHVNHFWRLLNDLGIPHVTLLDLDVARHNGGWGRIKYAATQLQKLGIDAGLTNAVIAGIPAWNSPDSRVLTNGAGWIAYLEGNGVFYSSPLDLDLMMISAFGTAYSIDPISDLEDPQETTVKAVLGKAHDAYADQYSADQQQLFDAYHSRFKLGSKPSNHVKALAALDDTALLSQMPAVLERLTALVEAKLETLPE